MNPTSRRFFLTTAGRAAFAGALTLFASASPASAQTPATLRVGTYAANEPWAFVGPRGELVGFDIDLMRALGRRLGVQVGFQSMPFSQLFTALNDGRIDAAICSITVTDKRRDLFDFSQPYYRTSQGVAVMRASGIRSLGDLKGSAVLAMPGSTNEEWVIRNAKAHGLGPAIPVSGIANALTLLESGEAGAYFGDLPNLLYQLLKRRDLAVIARLPTDDYYAVMLTKGSPLTPRIDEALAALKKEGVLAGIHKTWFGAQPELDSPAAIPPSHP